MRAGSQTATNVRRWVAPDFSRRNSGHVKKSTPNLAPTGGKVTRWNQLELAKRLGLSWER